MINKRIGPTTLPSDDKTFDERVLFVNRVARVVKGGRRFRFQALVVVGDHGGQVGMGVSKGADVTAAITKATNVAKKDMVKLPIRNGTLTHEVEAKVSGSHILIKPASPGTGLIAGGVIRTLLEVAGYENALSKSLGRNNKVNMAYATIAALTSMTAPSSWVTRKNQPAKTPSSKSKKRTVR
ncbi:30S ribosomal protein S5 [Candidatus Saccharibacteria bacterium RIFCSPHIGHO2_12_FULL_47_16b]|nr:MAG: 30S ribosomal protein S5 [Candidatus Saccharibacteria bacterium RIFCSPHIGHO2_12_FULL_47_16b]